MSALLDAAAASVPDGRPLPGEHDALLAFREQHAVGRAPVGRRIARPFGVAAAIGLLLGGGSVAAAATGSLPDPAQHVAHDWLDRVGISVPDAPSSRGDDGRPVEREEVRPDRTPAPENEGEGPAPRDRPGQTSGQPDRPGEQGRPPADSGSQPGPAPQSPPADDPPPSGGTEKPEAPGAPEEVGPPEKVGPPTTSGQPDTARPPEDPGPPKERGSGKAPAAAGGPPDVVPPSAPVSPKAGSRELVPTPDRSGTEEPPLRDGDHAGPVEKP